MELGEGARGPWRWDDVHTWAVLFSFLFFFRARSFFFQVPEGGVSNEVGVSNEAGIERGGRTITTFDPPLIVEIHQRGYRPLGRFARRRVRLKQCVSLCGGACKVVYFLYLGT